MTDPDRQSRLDEAIAEYLRLLDRGANDAEEFVLRHPEFASELEEFAAGQDGLRPLRGALHLPSGETTRAESVQSTSVPRAATSRPLNPAPRLRERFGPGSIIGGQYRVLDVKSGGMGVVYIADDLLAAQHGLRVKVAIKTVPDYHDFEIARAARGVSADPRMYSDFLARFRREAMTWIRLGKHKHVVLATAVEDFGAKPYLVMEYADGGSLQERLRQERLTIPQAVNFARQFCDGMLATARVGLVHRDIKPANLLIAGAGILKIADFGLAKASDPEPLGEAPDLTDSDRVSSIAGAGTVPYMAPEQFRSLRLADRRSDIFSFGVVLFEMLTGHQLFAASHAYESALMNQPLPSAHHLRPEVPEPLSAIAARCLRYKPEERYSSFAQIGAELAAVDSTINGRVPIPDDTSALPAEFFSPSMAILAETYALISLGRFTDAARHAQDGIDIDSTNAEHWINRGKALGELREFDQATRCFVRATQLRVDDARAWTNLAWTTLESGFPDRALAHARRATQFDDRFADAWMCQGACERRLGRPEVALSSFHRAHDLEPHSWKTAANLGHCLVELRRFDEAHDALIKAAAINPDDAIVWYQLAWIRSHQGHGAEARSAIDRCLAIDESNAEAWALRGLIIWLIDHDADGARSSLNHALRLDPANSQATVVLSAIAAEN